MNDNLSWKDFDPMRTVAKHLLVRVITSGLESKFKIKNVIVYRQQNNFVVA